MKLFITANSKPDLITSGLAVAQRSGPVLWQRTAQHVSFPRRKLAARKLAIQALLVIGLNCLITASCRAEAVTVAVASNFRSTLTTLIAQFENRSPHRIRPVSAATGVLYQQIRHGAPYDIFLAADSERPRRLAASGDAIADSRFTYATGLLALVSARPQALSRSSIEQLGSEHTLAIAKPEHAPYGLAAEQLLTNLAKNKSARVVYASNVAQAYQYVATGNADYGLISLAQAQQAKLHYWAVPAHYYSAIQQQAVLLNRAAQKQAAKAFLQFLQSPAATAIIQQAGYAPHNKVHTSHAH